MSILLLKVKYYMAQLLVLLTVAVILSASLLLKFKTKFNINILLKTLAVVYFLVCFFKMFFADGFIWVINGGVYGSTMYDRIDVLQTLLRWAMYLSSGVITVACFTNVKVFKTASVYFCLPLLVLSLFSFDNFIAYYMDGTGRGIHAVLWVRQFILGAEFVLGIVIPLLLVVIENKNLLLGKRDVVNLVAITPILAFSMFPVYTIQSLFGYTTIMTGMLKPTTFIWIGLTIAITFALIYIFRHKSYDQRFALCLWLSVILFMHYNSLYLMGFSIERLPIQLCNLGAYFFILCMITKSKRLFDFAFIANIVGTIIAMMVPDIEGGLGYFWNIHFMLEHMLVLIVPSVMMGVGLFPRVNKKSLVNIFVGFAIYFLVCLISGGLLNIFRDYTGEEVNFFYLFDSEIVFLLFPQAVSILKVNFVINGFTFYPLYILGVFVVFSVLMYGFYLLVQCFYKVTDDQNEIYANRQGFLDYLNDKKDTLINKNKQKEEENANN